MSEVSFVVRSSRLLEPNDSYQDAWPRAQGPRSFNCASLAVSAAICREAVSFCFFKLFGKQSKVFLLDSRSCIFDTPLLPDLCRVDLAIKYVFHRFLTSGNDLSVIRQQGRRAGKFSDGGTGPVGCSVLASGCALVCFGLLLVIQPFCPGNTVGWIHNSSSGQTKTRTTKYVKHIVDIKTRHIIMCVFMPFGLLVVWCRYRKVPNVSHEPLNGAHAVHYPVGSSHLQTLMRLTCRRTSASNGCDICVRSGASNPSKQAPVASRS